MSGKSGKGNTKRRGPSRWLNTNTLAVIVIGVAFCMSMARVMSIHKELFDPEETILRISHWQLELGYRGALQAVIDEYEKLNPQVRVIQIPVTEKVYGQWLNTHLISGTAPDLAEIGFAKLATDEQYMARFFLPLTELISQPNPYNDGMFLEGWPWRETFLDGMRSGYRPTLQDYFAAPTSMFTVRLFYNRDLLKEATGSDIIPDTTGGFLDACEALRQLGQRQGRQIVPIAGGRYNLGAFAGRYRVVFTSSLEELLDTNLDGEVSTQEAYTGFLQNKVGMQTPAIRAYYECMRAMCDNFAPGFVGIGREVAAYTFVLGKAGMIASGSWDAMSLFKQADFEVGVVDFPLPRAGERWHKHVVGRANEASTAGGGLYGVYKYSANRELAIDFLRFLTCERGNELLNRKAEWLPVIVASEPSERMRPFMPDPRGYAASVSFSYGNYALTIHEGQLERYLQGELDSYDEFAEQVEEALRSPAGGDRGWAIDYDWSRRWCRNQERVLAMQTIRAMLRPDESEDALRKYRQALLQQVRMNNGQEAKVRFERLRGRPIPEI